MYAKKIPLQDVYDPIQAEMISVQQKICEQFQSADAQLACVLDELSGRRGKLLRPALVLLSGKLISDLKPQHINFAVIVELIHMASLLYDDVIDKSQVRRNQPSANALWGNTVAVLLGDYLLSKAFTLVSFHDLNGATSVLGQTAQKLCTGELKQNVLKGRWDLTEQDYTQIIESKTASLFQSSCRLGADCSGGSEQQTQALSEFGFRFGLAFQIADDLRDILSSEKLEGKTLQTDLQEGKITLPLIHWINRDPNQVQCRITQLKTMNDPNWLTEQLHASGSIEYAVSCIQNNVSKAEDCLNLFKSSPSKDALLSLTHHIVNSIS